MIPDPTKRPIISQLATNWISMLGLARATTADRDASRAIPGVGRCHDRSRSTADSRNTINNDCTTCRQTPAADEIPPALLKARGIAGEVPHSEEHLRRLL